jgi:exonuclease SbcD
VKIACIADSHFREKDLDDVVHAHQLFCDDLREVQGVDLIVHAGDLLDGRSTPKERLAVADFLREALDFASIVIVRGNHESPEDLRLFERVRGAHEIMVHDRPGVVMDGPRCQVLALPWFDRQHLEAQLPPGASAERNEQASALAFRMVGMFRAFTEAAKARDAFSVLVAHALVQGSQTPTGQVLCGAGIEFGWRDLLASGADAVVLGHVHKHQWFGDDPDAFEVFYCGSPRPTDFGDAGDKGWVLLHDVGPSYFRPLKVRKNLLLESGALLPGTDADITTNLQAVHGSNVRLRLRVVEGDPRPDLDRWREYLLGAGANRAQVELVVERQARARAPEIVSARGPQEKLRGWASAKGLDAPTTERLVDLSTELQA